MFDTPETLYHYTTAAGLLGIFEPRELDGLDVSKDRSLTLWATDARYLNDAQELTFAADALATAMGDRAENQDFDPEYYDPEHREHIRKLVERIRQGNFLDPAFDDVPYTAYVTSFCEDPDLLSQWRGYGATGYSIAFPAQVLKKFWVGVLDQLTDTSFRGFMYAELRPVRYEIDNDFIEQEAERIVQRHHSFALQQALECLAQFKHPAFAAEREWRLFVSLEEGFSRCSFRVSDQGMVIPYLPLRFTPELIVEEKERHSGPVAESVRVGPSPDQDLRAVSVKRMLRQWFFDDVTVETSDTPFRG